MLPAMSEQRDTPPGAIDARGFLARASHEIRAPIQTIVGMGELLGETALGEVQKSYLASLRGAADQLLQLLDDVLDLSQIAGTGILRQDAFDLRDVVEGVVEAVTVRAQNKGLEIASVIDDGVSRFLVGDAQRIRQVLTNLLVNAIKYTAKGEVSLRVSRGGAGHVRFDVTDTGPGIPAEKQRAVFEPFHQLNTTTTKREGVGLGLTIARELAQKMGGTLTLTSDAVGAGLGHDAPGPGCTFSLELPLEPEENARRSTQRLGVQIRNLRFLIVDDSAVGRASVAQALHPWAPAIVEASSIAAACDCVFEAGVERREFSVVFVDAALDDAAAFATSIAPTPCVMLVDKNRLHTDEARVKAAGGVLLAKPVRAREVYKALLLAVAAEPTPTLLLPTAEQPLADLTGLRVLLVDDAAENRFLLSTMLSRSGCTIDVCGSGEEAVPLVLHAPADLGFDVVLMDMELPGISGRETTRRIRAAELLSKRRSRIIAVTAHNSQEAIQRCLDAGCDGHLGKPVTRQTLIAAVAAHGRAPPSPAPASLSTMTPAAGTPVVTRASLLAATPTSTLQEAQMAILQRDFRAVELAIDHLEQQRPGSTADLATAVRTRSVAQVRAALERYARTVTTTNAPMTTQPARATPLVPAPSASATQAQLAALLPGYLRSRQKDLEQLQAFLPANRLKDVAFIGHRMAGSGTAFGFPELTELGAALEVAGVAGDVATARMLVEQLARWVAKR